MEFLIHHIEALIFCAARPLVLTEIKNCLSEMLDTEVAEDDIELAIERLMQQYAQEQYSFQIYQMAHGYQFLTKPDYQSSVSILLKHQSRKRLSTAALETLSIIAYKQPVTKSLIEQIRGVGCDYALTKLLDKSLIEIKGKDDSIGRPLLYGTTHFFMQYFGINSLKDLPTPKDFAQLNNMIGEEHIETDDKED